MTTTITPVLRMIPVRDLVHANNIRHDAERAVIDEMKASIQSVGMVQNLIAAPRKSDGVYAVFAGATRLRSAQELVGDGVVAHDFVVPVMCYDTLDPESADAIAIAMSENMIRRQMDYVDECAAMLMLATSGRTEAEIAAIFGYKTRTVRERLLIGRLTSDAHRLVRDKVRNLDWARALTLADKAMQQKICDDIQANAASWMTGDDIRKFLTKATVPVEHALFDLADYQGSIVKDFFEGDKLSDIDAFWALQNAAIEDLRIVVETEGWREVSVTHQPFPEWAYEPTQNRAEGETFIEVAPSGKVVVHRGVKPIQATVSDAQLDEAETASAVVDDIAAFEVRPTPTICEYAAAQRTAMIQSAMAADFRKSLEYTVLAFLGHRNASFGAGVFALPGAEETHRGAAFTARLDVAEAIETAMNGALATPDRAQRDREMMAMVASMTDETLQCLFAGLVSQRVGQGLRRGVDDSETSLMNHFGRDIDVRAAWTPNEIFFSLMSSEDLRRIATAMMPGASVTRFAAAKKKDLVRSLSSNFETALEPGVMDAATAARFNAWVPGVLSFPATVAKAQNLEMDMLGDESVEDALFDAA